MAFIIDAQKSLLVMWYSASDVQKSFVFMWSFIPDVQKSFLHGFFTSS